MRPSSVLRLVVILTFFGSISVAGTAIVWSSGERILASMAGDVRLVMPDEPFFVQAEELGERLRNYRVRLRADGRLPGRINIVDPATGLVSPAANLNVALLQNGNVVTEFQSGLDGMFEAENVQPGVYSLVGHGQQGFIAYGLEVMPAELNVNERDAGDFDFVAFQEIQQELEIDSLAVPPTDGPSVLNLAGRNLPPEVVALAGQRSRDAGSPTQSQRVAPQAAPTPLNEAEDNPQAETAPSADLRQHEIRLAADGSLTGRMRSLHPQTGSPVRFRRLNVFLVRDNQIVAQAPVSPLGVFTLPELSDGFYSFVAAGTEGFTAFSIRTVSDSIAHADTPQELVVPVAFAQGQPGAPGGPQLDGVPGGGPDGSGMFGTLTSIEDAPYILYWLCYYYGGDDDRGAGALFGDGGAGGFGSSGFGGGMAGGGGGFAGGGSELGTLLGLGALGAAFGILASEDGGTRGTTIQIVSPAQL